MGVHPLMELCDHNHELLDYRTAAHVVDCHCIPFHAAWIIEVPHDEFLRKWKQTSTCSCC